MYFCVNRICVIPNNCYLQVRAYPPIKFAELNGDKDRIEYDVTVHTYVTYNMASVRVCAHVA